MSIIILMGPPGAGKGTLAQLCEKKGFEIIRGGDLLRKRSAQTDVLGLKLKEILSTGESIDDEIVREIIFQEIKNFLNLKKFCDKKVFFDGYPRNVKQLEYFFAFFSSIKINLEFKVFCLNLERTLLRKRIASRFGCSDCFFVQSIGGNCNNCNSKVFKRSDDSSPGAIEQRFDTFEKAKPAFVDFIKKNKIEFKEIKITEKMSELDVFRYLLKFVGLDDTQKVDNIING